MDGFEKVIDKNTTKIKKLDNAFVFFFLFVVFFCSFFCVCFFRLSSTLHPSKMVAIPKQMKTFCPGFKCKKHTLHKVSQYKKGKDSVSAQGLLFFFFTFFSAFFAHAQFFDAR